MTCADVTDVLESYLDGDLDQDGSRLTNAHIARCAECGIEVARAREVRGTLRGMDSTTCPEHVWQAISEELVRRDRPPVRAGARKGDSRRTWLAAGAAILLALASAGAWHHNQAGPTYSHDEIAEARQQVEFAFSVIARAGRITVDQLQEHVGVHIEHR